MKIALTAVKISKKIGDQSPMEGEQQAAPCESVVGVAITLLEVVALLGESGSPRRIGIILQ